jgi:hypothetical protein
LPFVEMGGEEVERERMQEDAELMMQILEPYLVQEVLAKVGRASYRVNSRSFYPHSVLPSPT